MTKLEIRGCSNVRVTRFNRPFYMSFGNELSFLNFSRAANLRFKLNEGPNKIRLIYNLKSILLKIVLCMLISFWNESIHAGARIELFELNEEQYLNNDYDEYARFSLMQTNLIIFSPFGNHAAS